jgi:hypothetical protein
VNGVLGSPHLTICSQLQTVGMRAGPQFAVNCKRWGCGLDLNLQSTSIEDRLLGSDKGRLSEVGRDLCQRARALLGRAPPASQWLRGAGVFARLFEEFGKGNPQRQGQTVQNVDRRIFVLAFEAANVRTIDLRIIRKPFLREASANPQPPQIPSYQGPPVHTGRRPSQRLLNHWL